jgi:hypothetical protein
MPKREPPEPQTGGRIEDTILQAEESLREQIQKARRFIEEGEATLAKLEAIRSSETAPSQRRTIASLPYIGWQVIDAIEHFLDEKAEPQTREDIVRAVLDRGVYLGKGEGAKGDPAAQVSKSLRYHLMPRHQKQKRYGNRIKALEPRLKEFPNGKIGRAEWK